MPDQRYFLSLYSYFLHSLLANSYKHLALQKANTRRIRRLNLEVFKTETLFLEQTKWCAGMRRLENSKIKKRASNSNPDADSSCSKKSKFVEDYDWYCPWWSCSGPHLEVINPPQPFIPDLKISLETISSRVKQTWYGSSSGDVISIPEPVYSPFSWSILWT